MFLALNEMSTKHDSLSVNDQHSTMKALCTNWVDLMATNYPSLATHMANVKVTREHMKLMIDSDSGENLLRKSKLAVQFVNNHLACSWIEPMQSPSGKGRDGS